MTSKTFREHIRQSLADENLQIALDGNARRRTDGRPQAFASLPDFQERRARAHAIKADVVNHLDEILHQFIEQVTANGIRVYRAKTADEAVRIFLEIASRHNARLVAKSKSMVTEEIHFNHALESVGIEVVETDLGEYIVQLRNERPSHIITPAVHLRREQVGQLFHEKLGVPYTEDIPEMVAIARRVLRQVFLTADIGVSGVNFGVAETGTLCMVTNEGNGRMVTTLPPVHVALMGIERLVPTLNDLALFLSLLPRSATGQKLSVYTGLIHSPCCAVEADGPQERYLILVDNGRSALQISPLSEALYCLRCGACLNACPVFREIGGHAYLGRDGAPAPYPGPIGSVISPGLFGCENFGHLAQASSLCGACKEACPVDIDLPKLLLRVRAGDVGTKPARPAIGLPISVKLGLKAFRQIATIPGLFAIGQRLGGIFSRIYSPRQEFMRIPAWTGWGFSKDFPRLASRPFRLRWKNISQKPVTKPVAVMPAQKSDPRPTAIYRSLAEQFADEVNAVGGKIYQIEHAELATQLLAFLQEKNITRVQADVFAGRYLPILQKAGITLTFELDPEIQVGLTGALAGIADTGSLVLLGGAGSSLTASLLPDIHIAILSASAIVPTLADALNRPEINNAPAAAIITGPSRTADIEMALTTGVHGPKEVHTFLVMDS